MNSPRTLRLARILSSQQRLSVHVDPRTKTTYKYLERDKALLKYLGDENTFGTFTSIFKLGINPSTEYNTPIGIYSYPIDYIVNSYRKETGIFDVPYPMPEKQQFIHVFSIPDLSRCLIFKTGDSDKLQAYRIGLPSDEINDRVKNAHRVVTGIYEYYRDYLSEADLGDHTGLYKWFGRFGGPWQILKSSYSSISDNPVNNMIQHLFGVDSYANFGPEYIESFLSSSKGTRFKRIVESGVAPDPTETLEDIKSYYQKYDTGDVTFPYEDRFKPLFYQEFGNDADYETFKKEIVLAAGQRVVCDQAYVWNASRHLAEFNPRKWTGFMRQMGFIGVVDYGTGTIHENEKTQAVFFNPSSIKLEETIDNRVSQYETKDQTRLNISNWTRKPDEHEITNAIDYASARVYFKVYDFIRELKEGVADIRHNPMERGRRHLKDAFIYIETLFKYLGWVTSHIKILGNKPFWQEEIKRSVDRIRESREKLAPFMNTVHSVKPELQELDKFLVKIIRNFGNWL